MQLRSLSAVSNGILEHRNHQIEVAGDDFKAAAYRRRVDAGNTSHSAHLLYRDRLPRSAVGRHPRDVGNDCNRLSPPRSLLPLPVTDRSIRIEDRLGCFRIV
jgi:hypothetical protein